MEKELEVMDEILSKKKKIDDYISLKDEFNETYKINSYTCYFISIIFVMLYSLLGFVSHLPDYLTDPNSMGSAQYITFMVSSGLLFTSFPLLYFFGKISSLQEFKPTFTGKIYNFFTKKFRHDKRKVEQNFEILKTECSFMKNDNIQKEIKDLFENNAPIVGTSEYATYMKYYAKFNKCIEAGQFVDAVNYVAIAFKNKPDAQSILFNKYL